MLSNQTLHRTVCRRRALTRASPLLAILGLLFSQQLCASVIVLRSPPSLATATANMPFTASDICKIILAIILVRCGQFLAPEMKGSKRPGKLTFLCLQPPLGVFLERGCVRTTFLHLTYAQRADERCSAGRRLLEYEFPLPPGFSRSGTAS